MSKLDLSKPLQTKSGDPVSVIAAPDGRLCGWRNTDGHYSSEEWSDEGVFCGRNRGPYYEKNGSLVDLVNVPEKRTVKVFINAYDDRLAVHFSARDAETCATDARVAYVETEITFTIGEGLAP